MAVLLAIFGYAFFRQFFIQNQMEMNFLFAILPIAFAIFIPIVTMLLLANEFNTGTYEVLSTTSVSTLDIVLGKFIAAFLFSAILIAPTILYPISISFIGDLDWGPVIGGYLASLLLIAALTGIGLFFSAITKEVILAAILSLLVSLTFSFVLFYLVAPLLPPAFGRFVEAITMNYHFQMIGRGVIDVRTLIYFLSITAVSLYGTKLVLDLKK
jgi:ABC-2 type transport system permease protein